MTTQIVVASICGFLVSALLTWALSNWARKRKAFMHEPRERDIHSKPVPRVGGMAMVATFIIVVVIANIINPDLFATLGFPFKILGVSIDKRLLGLLLGSVILAISMAVDDYRGLKPWVKLFWQAVVWAVVVACGIGLVYLNNPFGIAINLGSVTSSVQLGDAVYHIVWIADIILFFWLVGMMNAVNFIDGADGLAGGIGIIGFIVIGILSLMPTVGQPAVAMLSFAAAAVTAGFLIFNIYPAKVFLGDVGAMWIGFMLAVLSVISGGKLATLFLVLALIIIDGFVVVINRIIKGKDPLATADQTHIHHRFMQAGLSVRASVLLIWIVSACFGFIGLVTEGRTKWTLVLILALASLIFLVWIRKIDKRDNGQTSHV